jgi:hypothetical protein
MFWVLLVPTVLIAIVAVGYWRLYPQMKRIDLHWEDTSDNEEGFRIYRITSEGKTKIADVGANVTTYTDKSPASKACYVVTAFNSAGESDPSNISCVDNSSENRRHLPRRLAVALAK